MLKALTYKQKNIGLLILFLLMLFISWTAAIENTVDLQVQNNDFKEAIKLATTAPEQIETLTQKLKYLERKLFYDRDEKTNRQDKLLQLTGKLCKEKNLTLRSFPEVQQETFNDYLIETNVIEIEGNYTSIVELIYSLEQTHRAGKISSVKFETIKDRRIKTKILTAIIYLQIINPKTDEI